MWRASYAVVGNSIVIVSGTDEHTDGIGCNKFNRGKRRKGPGHGASVSNYPADETGKAMNHTNGQ